MTRTPAPRPRSPRRSAARPSLAAAMLLALPVGAAAQRPLAPEHFDALDGRNLGPAGMSGRVSAVDVVLSQPMTVWVGAATGGVFRSRDGGVTWDPVFDEQPVLGIGSVAVFEPNPDVVWVGTGEGNPRNSAGVGNGVYRSIDGGETWSHLGLEGSERIHRVVLHPSDPDVAFVAAMGPAWSDGEERGVYRTTDGGESWERVLWVGPSTGAADLVMDPTNPDVLFAAMWDFRRDPWFFRSGGPGSGLFVTRDGGDRWTELTASDGLPAGDLGRIGVAVAPSDPEVVYALVEAERSALVRSDDGGRTFREVTSRPGIAPRPFYYADLRVDPRNENRIYSLHGAIQVSEDQGRSFRTVVPSSIVHGDVHELWIHPEDPRTMIMGNDGGIAFTYDRGEAWRFVENLTLAQFYRISVDDRIPFNVYGGLQDNGSWFGPSDVWENKGILNAHWTRVGGGDGFQVHDDPSSERHLYAASQEGNLTRVDRVTGERKPIQPVHPDGVRLRFNWNAGFAVDPHDGRTIYLGSQFVHRSRDHGASWEIISPDLTTDDPSKQRQDESGGLTLDATGAENHTTIFDIAPSPLTPGVLWVGTDDGNVQLTRDGGATWTEVGRNIPGAPRTGWVSDVEPSHHDPAAAWVTFDEHRRGDWTTYLFHTDDWGRSWSRVGTEGVFGFAHDLEEDPEAPGLLFLGTEFGLWTSVDRGRSWSRFDPGALPPAPVREAVVHPRDGDLVVGTHGRGAWVVDDVRPLREIALDPSIRESAVHLFQPPPAWLRPTAEAPGYRSTGMAMWQGETRPDGALLSYWAGGEGAADLTIRDADGRVVRTLTGPAAAGINRVVWNLRAGEPPEPGGPWFDGAEVLPGRYGVEVAVGDAVATGTVEVRLDPRDPRGAGPRRETLALLATLARWVETLEEARERLRLASRGVELVLETLPPVGADELLADGAALAETLDALETRLFTGPSCQGICGGQPVADRVRAPISRLRGSGDAPTPTDRLMVAQGREALSEIVAAVNAVMSGEVAAYRERLRASGFTPFPVREPLRVPPGGG